MVAGNGVILSVFFLNTNEIKSKIKANLELAEFGILNSFNRPMI